MAGVPHGASHRRMSVWLWLVIIVLGVDIFQFSPMWYLLFIPKSEPTFLLIILKLYKKYISLAVILLLLHSWILILL